VKAGVMSTRKSITVTRDYKLEADACLHALITLLKKPANHEGSPSPATLGNDGRIKGDSADDPSIRH
jgi:hypothetical protein